MDTKKTSKNTKKKPAKKDMQISFDEIISFQQELDGDASKAFDKSYVMFDKLKQIPKLEEEQVEQFFSTVKSKVGEMWIQFLTKASLKLNPTKWGNDEQFVSYIVRECMRIADEHNLSSEDFINAGEEFFKKKDISIISRLLNQKAALKDASGNTVPQHILASIVFIPFSLDCRQRGFENHKIQILIDRAITEFLTADTKHEKDNAGSTLGALLSAKVVSTKKVSELMFLYSGTTEKIAGLEEQVFNLRQARESLADSCSLLTHKLEAHEQTNIELKQRISELEEENKKLTQSRDDARAMLDFETHKFENLLKTREEGVAERYYSSISLELEAIRELCDYIGENDQKRILRRLDRISSILLRNKGKQNG